MGKIQIEILAQLKQIRNDIGVNTATSSNYTSNTNTSNTNTSNTLITSKPIKIDYSLYDENNVEENQPINSAIFEIEGLPCSSYESFMELEKQCHENKEAEKCLFDLFKKNRESDILAFVKSCMKKLIADEAAIKFTWFGFHNNTAVKGFRIIKILTDVCLERFPNLTEDDVHKYAKKWFHYAKDRVRKHDRRHNVVIVQEKHLK